jgi:hypothetical protein
MCVELHVRAGVQLIAGIKDRERLDLFAANWWDRLQPVVFIAGPETETRQV